MKKYFIILGLILTLAQAFAVEKIYLQEQTPYSTNPFIRKQIYIPYNPYYTHYNPYHQRNYNYSNIKRMHRINKIRQLNRIRNNYLTWNNKKNPFKGGYMTGFSPSINEDIYEKMGITPMDSKKNSKSVNCNTDLFSSPSGNEMYYNNGEMKRDLGSTSSKSGVTIIYD